jgi:hypothetical protein
MGGLRTTGYRLRVRGVEAGVPTVRFVFGGINYVKTLPKSPAPCEESNLNTATVVITSGTIPNFAQQNAAVTAFPPNEMA